MNISTSDLGSFLAVAKSGHLTDTAAALGIPQPTLSRRIARLEEELGATLFDRVGRSLQLNARGRAFLEHAEAAVTATQAGAREVHRLMDPERGTVRIGFMHSLGTWAIPNLLREYRTQHPHVQFELQQGSARELEEAVLADVLDLAFVSPAPSSAELSWKVLATQPLGLAVPVDHRLAGHAAVALADADSESFIGMGAGYGIQIILEQLASEAGFQPTIAFTTQEMNTVAGLVSAGLGVALLPRDQRLLEFEGVVLIPLDPPREREIGIIWRTGLVEAPPVELFREFVLERRA